jgi:hypothetical protein
VGVRLFNRALQTASKHHIPSGYREDFVPGLPREAVDLAKEQDRKHEIDPQDPEVSHLNEAISEMVSSEPRHAWKETVESSSPHTNTDKYWKLLRNLSGKNVPSVLPINQSTSRASATQNLN